jgi:hypothetical protein
MSFLSELAKEVSSYPKISLAEIIYLGYNLADRKMVATGYPNTRFISELIDEDNNKIVSFCFFWSVITKDGFILPHPLNHYLMKKVNLSNQNQLLLRS